MKVWKWNCESENESVKMKLWKWKWKCESESVKVQPPGTQRWSCRCTWTLGCHFTTLPLSFVNFYLLWSISGSNDDLWSDQRSKGQNLRPFISLGHISARSSCEVWKWQSESVKEKLWKCESESVKVWKPQAVHQFGAHLCELLLGRGKTKVLVVRNHPGWCHCYFRGSVQPDIIIIKNEKWEVCA